MFANKRLLIVIAAVTVTIVIIIAALLGHRAATQQTLSLSQPFAVNLRYAHQASADKVYYFGGNTFKELTISTQVSRALTPTLALPNIIDVRWSEQGALFKATNYGALDQLRPQLVARDIKTDAAYWWAIDFRTGAITLVGTPDGGAPEGTNVIDALWSSDGQAYYYLQLETFQDQSPRTTLFSSSLKGPAKPVGRVDFNRLVWTNGSHLVYHSTHNEQHKVGDYDLKNLTSRVLRENYEGPVAINGDGTRGLFVPSPVQSGYETYSNTNGPLENQNLSDLKATTATKAFTGSFAWNRAGTDWAAVETTEEGTLRGYSGTTTGASKLLTFELPKDATLPKGLYVVGYEDGRVLLLDESNTAYLAAVKLPKLKTAVPSNPNRTIYVGTTKLIEHGVSTFQVDSLKRALYDYAVSSDRPGNAITIDERSVEKVPRDRESESITEIINFRVSIDNSVFVARMEYFDLTSMRVYLYTGNYEKEVYDSKVITTGNSN
jgi:hypothetical protein